ncbi:MAG: outer membrane protein transport protein [Sulfurovum sp.]|uniref:OmpP1/FadL family transporter n=1 Tax=Sulfurovum sp. TaxID=1969726 RepID=UPI002867C284|nr:outer membrane protein transport protein [Sulfurovum sp.]MCO4846156.1 outer membrane protein transport protein [Sulfurovum sp.]
MNIKTTRTIAKVITLSLITSTMIHATNGDNLIAVGTKARGMGGTGIAVSHGAESGLGNAALITSVEGTEIAFGGTIFMPDIKTSLAGMPTYTSDADMNMIPEVSIAHKIDDNWYIGIGMWGTAGLGVDYSKAGTNPGGNANMHMVTNLQLMQFGVPIAYKTGGLSIAVTPILQYGNLDIDYDGALMVGTTPNSVQAGAGLAQEFGFGYNIGLAYDFSANGVDGLTLGAIYKSSIEMDYDYQLTTATGPFVGFNLIPPGAVTDTLEQPEEYGVGIAYEMGQHTIAFDYKKIKWSNAKGYGDFGWDDSNVYAIGYQYTENEWTVRLGYNYADSAVVEQDGSTATGTALNFFNLLGFPANAERHYTVGASYEVTKAFSVDLAYVYLDKTTDTFDLSYFQNFSTMNPDSITTSHEENSISFQLAYKF